jgi:tRNA (guanosine-2'-O-)-methyltransferase
VKRTLPEVEEVGPLGALPFASEDIVRVLAPLVTEARLGRIDSVIARRTRSLVPVLEGLSDPHNGAAILRSADAFGCHEVHIVEGRLPFAISHRVSKGTHRWLDLVRSATATECATRLRARGYRIFVASMEGTMTPEDLGTVEKAAVVLGNEHAGPSEEMRALADGTYRIPMVGFVESLNVSVASAITLYVATRGRHGDLDAAAQSEIRARFLMQQVRDADRLLREKLGT